MTLPASPSPTAAAAPVPTLTLTLKRILTLAFCLHLTASSSRGDETWNQFRGPAGSGVARGSNPPAEPGEANLAWKTPVPPGLSSPVVAGRLVVLTGVDAGKLVTLAFDRRSGDVAWRREAPEVDGIEMVHKTSSPAAPSAASDGTHVFVYFGSSGLTCYDLAGTEVWTKAIPTPRSLYGTATSPVLHGDHLILVVDDDENLEGSELSRSRVFAVRKSDGESVWETPRPFNRSGWSTPTVWEHDAGTDLVVLGDGRVIAYDPATGTERWFATGFSRETIAIPVAGDGHVIVSAAQLGGGADESPDPAPFWDAVMKFDANGDGELEPSEMTGHFTYPLRPDLPLDHPGFGFPLPSDPERRRERLEGIFGWVDTDKNSRWTRDEFVAHMGFKRGRPVMMALRPGGSGDVTASHATWQFHRGIPEIPSPVYFDGRVYLVRDGGVLTAVRAADGTEIYRERVGASGGYSASPVIAGGRLYLVSNRGTLTVADTGDSFRTTHQFDLDEPARVTPAFDENTLYLRTDQHLWAFRSEG